MTYTCRAASTCAVGGGSDQDRSVERQHQHIAIAIAIITTPRDISPHFGRSVGGSHVDGARLVRSGLQDKSGRERGAARI